VCGQAKKIMEHRRKYERAHEEQELKKRKERIRKAREEYEKHKEVSVVRLASIIMIMVGNTRTGMHPSNVAESST
jgi:hypothetical protein